MLWGRSATVVSHQLSAVLRFGYVAHWGGTSRAPCGAAPLQKSGEPDGQHSNLETALGEHNSAKAAQQQQIRRASSVTAMRLWPAPWGWCFYKPVAAMRLLLHTSAALKVGFQSQTLLGLPQGRKPLGQILELVGSRVELPGRGRGDGHHGLHRETRVAGAAAQLG